MILKIIILIIIIVISILIVYNITNNKNKNTDKNTNKNKNKKKNRTGKRIDTFENGEEVIISGAKANVPDLIFVDAKPEVTTIMDKTSGMRKKIPFIIETTYTGGDPMTTTIPIYSKGINYKIEIPAYTDFGFSGRGLVIAGSGLSYRYVTGIYINIYIIRKVHNSNIPIEIFYVSENEEFPEIVRLAILKLEGVTFINLLDRIDVIGDTGGLGASYNEIVEDLRGYQTKPLACLCSSFKEIVLMDADAICFIDPNYFFNINGYVNHGMVLFKDYVKCLSFVSKDFINKIGIGADKFCRKTGSYEIDSSCIVIDKERAWDALFTICVINVKSEQYYRHKNHKIRYDEYGEIIKDNVLGDKDTWLIGSMFVDFDPFIDSGIDPVHLFVNGQSIDGHFQRGTVTVDGQTKTIPLYYNNQKLKFENLTSENLKTVKYSDSLRELPENVINTFLASKDAIAEIKYSLPMFLLNQRPQSNDIYYLGFLN